MVESIHGRIKCKHNYFSSLYSPAPSLGFHSRSVALPSSFKARWKSCSCLCVYLSELRLKCAEGTLLTHSVQRVTPGRTHLHPLRLPALLLCSPGSQLYHSVTCVFVQFLMLRLMGRTVTTVLCSFTFQMVSSFIVVLPLFILRCRVFICTTHQVVRSILWSVKALFVSCSEEMSQNWLKLCVCMLFLSIKALTGCENMLHMLTDPFTWAARLIFFSVD